MILTCFRAGCSRQVAGPSPKRGGLRRIQRLAFAFEWHRVDGRFFCPDCVAMKGQAAMNARESLPNRRAAETFEFEHRNPDGSLFRYAATVGFYDDGRIGEVFLSAVQAGHVYARSGTTLDIGIKDSAIALSLALQYGCPLEVIAPTFLRTGGGVPEGPLGTLVGLLVERFGAGAAS